MDHDLKKILKVLNRLAPTHSPLTEVEYLPGGYSNKNYRIQLGSKTHILRICSSTPSNASAEQSYLTLPIAPKLVHYDESTGDMLTEFVDGSLLVEEPFGVEESVAYLRDLHRRIPTGTKRHDPVGVSLAQFAKADTDNELSRFLKSTTWRPRQVRGCHNDLNPYNIVRLNEDEAITLDWEFAGDNEVLFDLVNLCYGLAYSDSDFVLCATKYSGTHYDPKFLLLTRMVFQIREHSWALAQVALGNDRREIREQAANSMSEFRRLNRMYVS